MQKTHNESNQGDALRALFIKSVMCLQTGRHMTNSETLKNKIPYTWPLKVLFIFLIYYVIRDGSSYLLTYGQVRAAGVAANELYNFSKYPSVVFTLMGTSKNSRFMLNLTSRRSYG